MNTTIEWCAPAFGAFYFALSAHHVLSYVNIVLNCVLLVVLYKATTLAIGVRALLLNVCVASVVAALLWCTKSAWYIVVGLLQHNDDEDNYSHLKQVL